MQSRLAAPVFLSSSHMYVFFRGVEADEGADAEVAAAAGEQPESDEPVSRSSQDFRKLSVSHTSDAQTCTCTCTTATLQTEPGQSSH